MKIEMDNFINYTQSIFQQLLKIHKNFKGIRINESRELKNDERYMNSSLQTTIKWKNELMI